MANSYLKGQSVRCSVVFKDNATGAYVDPTTVTFRTLDPSNNASSHVYGVDVNVVKDSVGHYHYDLYLDESGDWYYRWECSGTYIGAAEARVVSCAPAWSAW